MTNTTTRILTSFVMATVIAVAAWFGFVQYLAVAVAVAMSFEVLRKSFKKLGYKTLVLLVIACLAFIASAWIVGSKPWIMLLLFMIIASTDTAAWYFGRMIKGDKMWSSISPNKTWAGQIAGIIGGTFAAVIYGLLGTDTFLSSLMWIGISVALLSQYGDLAASALKRKLQIKDFSNILPGHGGLMDRFDGWIFVLPIVWLAML
jgi:phosphatidate cytidylyltransferase